MATITNPHTSLPKQSWKMEKKKSPPQITQCQISHWIHFSPLTPMTPSPHPPVVWTGGKNPQKSLFIWCVPQCWLHVQILVLKCLQMCPNLHFWYLTFRTSPRGQGQNYTDFAPSCNVVIITTKFGEFIHKHSEKTTWRMYGQMEPIPVFFCLFVFQKAWG